jgi:hypothetical protein
MFTVVSRYYDMSSTQISLITIPNQHSNHHQTLEICTGYIDSLDILIHFPYPNSN